MFQETAWVVPLSDVRYSPLWDDDSAEVNPGSLPLSIAGSPHDSDNKELRRRGFVPKRCKWSVAVSCFFHRFELLTVLCSPNSDTTPVGGKADGWSKEHFLSFLIVHGISCLCTVHWEQ
jgi:hypothetical protein